MQGLSVLMMFSQDQAEPLDPMLDLLRSLQGGDGRARLIAASDAPPARMVSTRVTAALPYVHVENS